MSDKPIFLEYDSEAKKAELIKLFEEQTETTLYPAQDASYLINLIEYKAGLLVQLFNEAAALNLPQFSRDSFLDYIGEMVGTDRLEGEYGEDILKIELVEAFSSDLTISKGLEVMSKDEKYIFSTTSDLVIPAGETIGYVLIKSNIIGEDVNVYGAGDVNILVKPFSYIRAVSNVNGISGGFNPENDEAFLTRILLAPESFSCAGSKKSYIYHTLSAHTSILDAQAEAPQIPASIEFNDVTYIEENGFINGGENFSAEVDYKLGQCRLTIGENEYTIKIPPQSTVYVYPLTADDETPQSVIDAVNQKFNGEEINPMCDDVVCVAPIKKEVALTINAVVDISADLNITNKLINKAVLEYANEIRSKLNSEIIPSQIIKKIANIEGVFDCNCGDLEHIRANINEYIAITATINVTQRGSD